MLCPSEGTAQEKPPLQQERNCALEKTCWVTDDSQVKGLAAQGRTQVLIPRTIIKFQVGFRSQTRDKWLQSVCLTYQRRHGHHVLPATLSPYLLLVMTAIPCHYPKLLQHRGWAALTYIIQTFWLLLLLLRCPGCCTWFFSFPCLFPSPSLHMAQGHAHSGLSQVCLPLAMLSHVPTINRFLHCIEEHLYSFNFFFPVQWVCWPAHLSNLGTGGQGIPRTNWPEIEITWISSRLD